MKATKNLVPLMLIIIFVSALSCTDKQANAAQRVQQQLAITDLVGEEWTCEQTGSRYSSSQTYTIFGDGRYTFVSQGAGLIYGYSKTVEHGRVEFINNQIVFRPNGKSPFGFWVISYETTKLTLLPEALDRADHSTDHHIVYVRSARTSDSRC